MSDYETIQFSIEEGVANIVLDRPDSANGLTLTMCEELHDAAIRCDRSDEVRAVLISANGKMFCAGGDIKFFREAGDNVGDIVIRMTHAFHAAISLFNRMAAPVVIAVNGTAAGGGLSFAITGDIVISARSAKYCLAYTAAALSPDGSSSWFLPRLIGLRRARELMLTNRVLSADEAQAYGMIDRVVDDEALADEARAQAAAFASGPTQAYGAVKTLLNDTFSQGLEAQMEAESRAIAIQASSADGQEGIEAFVEKRKPRFTGS